MKQENREQNEVAMQSKAYTRMYNERPHLRGRVFAVNNNSENKVKGALNKAMGVYGGVSDMLMMIPNGKWVCIEWKTETGVQSEGQKEWQKLAESLGNTYIVVRSENEFFSVIDKYDL